MVISDNTAYEIYGIRKQEKVTRNVAQGNRGRGGVIC